MSIAGELTRRGIITPSGKLGWSAYSVRHILGSWTYAGVMEALKTEAVEPKVRKAATYGKSSRRSRPENDRILLRGLVERPIVIEEEFELMQRRLRENQQLSRKNTKLRSYGLKGMIRCTACGKAYVGVTLKRHGREYAYSEKAVYGMVVDFLHVPEGFEAELQRRMGGSAETESSLIRESESLEGQHREELDAEARAFRLASRGTVSEEVFNQEIGLIRTRQRWLTEQRERLEQQLADLRRYRFDPENVEMLRQRLEARLATGNARRPAIHLGCGQRQSDRAVRWNMGTRTRGPA